MSGPIGRFLAADHARLAALATALASDAGADGALAAGLLRHLAWEEGVLLPLVQQLREGEPLPVMTRVRLEHRAVRALLVPALTPPVARSIRRVLAAHDAFEEAVGGLYDVCDTMVSTDADALVARLHAAPCPEPPARMDDPAALAALRRALAQARLPPLED